MARVQLTATQTLIAQQAISTLARALRGAGVSDQDMAEWLLSLSCRWLAVHGVSIANVHAWADAEMREAHSPLPLVAAARSRNDFGGGR